MRQLLIIFLNLLAFMSPRFSMAQNHIVHYLTGNSADTNTAAIGGLLLMGGSTDVDVAMKWFLQRASGGDVVVIRSSGADGYNDYMFHLVPVHAVETILIDSREKAEEEWVVQKINNAEALFIAGGDQSDYVQFWQHTATEKAINFLINTKKVTVGGTSAGLAILGGAYYSALFESAGSVETLANPYHKNTTLGAHDFITVPLLANVITDSHYTQRDRQGRHISFMARLMTDFGIRQIKGIGIDEKTALCIDENGQGTVYGTNSVYFLNPSGKKPELCKMNKPLNWNHHGRAIEAIVVKGSEKGNGNFDALNFRVNGGEKIYYAVKNGRLLKNK
jgi:cyanophycinase